MDPSKVDAPHHQVVTDARDQLAALIAAYVAAKLTAAPADHLRLRREYELAHERLARGQESKTDG